MTLFKRIITAWYIWAFAGLILGFLFFQKSFDLASVFPFALLLICPVMMIFMMKDHHKH